MFYLLRTMVPEAQPETSLGLHSASKMLIWLQEDPGIHSFATVHICRVFLIHLPLFHAHYVLFYNFKDDAGKNLSK